MSGFQAQDRYRPQGAREAGARLLRRRATRLPAFLAEPIPPPALCLGCGVAPARSRGCCRRCDKAMATGRIPDRRLPTTYPSLATFLDAFHGRSTR